MCTGEKGGKLTFAGMKFYRIIDRFIDQASAAPPRRHAFCPHSRRRVLLDLGTGGRPWRCVDLGRRL